MLNQICFVSNDWSLYKSYSKKKADTPFIFNICLNEPKLKETAYSLYKLSHEVGAVSPLSLCLDFSRLKKNKKWNLSDFELDVFIQILFHCAFLTENNIPVVFYKETQLHENKFEELKQTIRKYVECQGFKGVHFLPVNEVNLANKIFTDDYSALEEHPFSGNIHKQLYHTHYLKKGIFGEYLSLHTDTVESFLHLKEDLKDAEELLRLEEPAFYGVLEQSKSLKNHLEEAEMMYESCLKELANHKQYLQIIKIQDDAKNINRFYYYEYEILPLWYKQLGHIIKVLIGRRSFRSLFDNNVNKYLN